jgi:type I restriction enzyme S subunit
MKAKGNWKTVRLGDVCRVIPGYAFKSKDWCDSGIPVIKIKNIQEDRTIDIGETDHVPESVFSERLRKFVLEDGDILLAMTGATAGKVGRLRTKKPMLLNQRVAKILPVDANPDFIWAVISSENYQSKFFYLADGAAQPNMSGGQIEGVEINVPDLPTQRKIAGVLSAYDDLIENNLRRIKILEEMAQSLYREWFVHFRFPGHESAKFVDSALGQIPEGWELKVMTEAVSIRPKVSIQKGGYIPFVTMGGLSENSMLITEVEQRESPTGSRFQNGDTLFARITPCLENGKTGFVEFLSTKEAAACGSTEFIVLRSKTLCPEYVYLMARSDPFRDNAIKSMSGATGRQRVRDECFEQFFLAQPPEELLARFESITRPQFELIHSLNRRNQTLRRTRDLLLPKLLNGDSES